MTEESGSLHCKVCAAPISCIHLGMEICRACSSFFKRVKTNSRQYPCRTGDRKCAAGQGGKFKCRRCRFEKCLSIGLEYHGPMRERRKEHPISLLQSIQKESKAFTERRKAQELNVIRTRGGHLRIAHHTEELYEMHQDTCNEIYRIFVAEARNFFDKVFPAFADLDSKEQESIFKNYAGNLSLIEGYLQTRQIWGKMNRQVMCSVVTCVDLERQYEGIENIENGTLMISFARSFTKDQLEICLPLFERFGPDDQEFYALMALVLTDQDTDISEEAHHIIYRYRQDVLLELQMYYRKELGMENISTKLGNLMSFYHAIQECRSHYKVFMRFYTTMFDVFITENSLKEYLF